MYIPPQMFAYLLDQGTRKPDIYIYVDGISGNDSNSGLSWQEAFLTPNVAISAAAVSGMAPYIRFRNPPLLSKSNAKQNWSDISGSVNMAILDFGPEPTNQMNSISITGNYNIIKMAATVAASSVIGVRNIVLNCTFGGDFTVGGIPGSQTPAFGMNVISNNAFSYSSLIASDGVNFDLIYANVFLSSPSGIALNNPTALIGELVCSNMFVGCTHNVVNSGLIHYSAAPGSVGPGYINDPTQTLHNYNSQLYRLVTSDIPIASFDPTIGTTGEIRKFIITGGSGADYYLYPSNITPLTGSFFVMPFVDAIFVDNFYLESGSVKYLDMMMTDTNSDGRLSYSPQAVGIGPDMLLRPEMHPMNILHLSTVQSEPRLFGLTLNAGYNIPTSFFTDVLGNVTGQSLDALGVFKNFVYAGVSGALSNVTVTTSGQ